MTLIYRYMDSPVGRLKLVAEADHLVAVLWENDRPGRVRLGVMSEDRGGEFLRGVEQQLSAYFAGNLTRFDLALRFHGTEFQRKVWQALLTIPFGETRSYRDIATQIGNPAAVRAVGAANGKNPISIIAPCHRVIGSSGALTGFAGGLEAKQILLGLEGQATFHSLWNTR
jgi:methylated-DNA-[protein]-cysteine S-methyltransferase